MQLTKFARARPRAQSFRVATEIDKPNIQRIERKAALTRKAQPPAHWTKRFQTLEACDVQLATRSDHCSQARKRPAPKSSCSRVLRPIGCSPGKRSDGAWFAFFATIALSGCSQRMGHNVEDLTSVPSGPLAGHVAALDGYDVYITPTTGSPRPPTKAFDLFDTSITGGARGIAYLPEQEAFVFTNPRVPGYLLRTDSRGNELDPLKLTYPEDYVHYHSEGLAYLPKHAPKFGGKLLMVGVQIEPEFAVRLFVVNMQGVVEDEINFGDDIRQGWIASVAYDLQGGLWLSQGDNKIHHVDLEGNKIEDPVEIKDAQSLEGIASFESGMFVGDLFDGKLRHLDAKRQRHPEQDRNYEIGKGVSFPLALAWRNDLKQIAVQHLVPNGFRFVSTPVNLDEATKQFTLEKDATYESSMTWIDSEGVYAVLRKSSGEVWFVDTAGKTQATLDLSAHMPIEALDYVPRQNQFVILTSSSDDQQELRLLSRDGQAVGEFNLKELSGISSGVSMTSYAFGDKVYFAVAQTPEQGNQIVAFDLDGTQHWNMNYRKKLGIVYPSNLTAIDMELQPSLAVSDAGSSKIAVFSPEL